MLLSYFVLTQDSQVFVLEIFLPKSSSFLIYFLLTALSIAFFFPTIFNMMYKASYPIGAGLFIRGGSAIAALLPVGFTPSEEAGRSPGYFCVIFSSMS